MHDLRQLLKKYVAGHPGWPIRLALYPCLTVLGLCGNLTETLSWWITRRRFLKTPGQRWSGR